MKQSRKTPAIKVFFTIFMLVCYQVMAIAQELSKVEVNDTDAGS